MELLARLVSGCREEKEKGRLLEAAEEWVAAGTERVLGRHRMFKIEVNSMVVELYIGGIAAIRGVGGRHQALLLGAVESVLQLGWPHHPRLLLRSIHLCNLLL